MKRIIFLGLFAVIVATQPGHAQEYDGIYRPAGSQFSGWNCRDVGSDGGAVAIRNGRFEGVENSCLLSNPVPVRDMNATLYDAECSAEGMIERYRLMLMRNDEGVVVIRNGYASSMTLCE